MMFDLFIPSRSAYRVYAVSELSRATVAKREGGVTPLTNGASNAKADQSVGPGWMIGLKRIKSIRQVAFLLIGA